MLLIKQKKSQNNGKEKNKNKMLITVNVLGSAGPLRFVVNDDEIVSSIVIMALKSYAREGRRPVIGSSLNDFLLYCPLLGSDALDPFDLIGAHGARNFLLCKRTQPEKTATDVETQLAGIARKSKGSWKTWINKTLSLKIASH